MSDRRAFLKFLSIVTALPVSAKVSAALGGKQGNPSNVGKASVSQVGSTFSESVVISAFDDDNGHHYIGAYDEGLGAWVARVRVSKRYHSSKVLNSLSSDHSSNGTRIVFVSRRPGDQVVVLDLSTRQVIEYTAPLGRHFFGHADVDDHGRIWFTEHDFHLGRSLLVCRSWDNLSQELVVIDLDGHGPHELVFLSDGITAVVGLGGIKTHPNTPREKLNIESMQSELLVVDTLNKKVVGRYKPSDPQLSLRHLDVYTGVFSAVRQDHFNDIVVVGAQYQGPTYDQFPLVYLYQRNLGLVAMQAPESVWRSMNQYIASVRVNTLNNEVLVTCPRSNAVHLFSLSNKSWMGQYRLKDPGGAAISPEGFYMVSTGMGQIVCLASKNGALTLVRSKLVSDTRWDNHMDRVMLS